MTRRLVLVVALALLALHCDSRRAAPKEPLLKVGDFTLVDDRGQPFHLSSLHGTPSLLFFGYTHCPDACPTMMALVARSYRLAGSDARSIPTLFVSVDPRDTPAVLREYVSYFKAIPARGLTGTKPQIDKVVAQFGARYEIHDSGSAGGPSIDHTVRLYLIDKNGNVAALFDPTSTPEEIAKAMRAALAG